MGWLIIQCQENEKKGGCLEDNRALSEAAGAWEETQRAGENIV